MSLIEAIEKGGRLSPFTVPELRYLSAAAERVRERWPDVRVTKTEQEREALAQQLRVRVERDDWVGTRLSFVVIAASAVFDPERRDRSDLARTRDFIYAEIAASTSETLLSGLFRTYLDSFVIDSPHSATLATTLGEARLRMSSGVRLLLEAVPELLDPISGPDRLADRMAKMSDPYTELMRLGIRNPHGGGFMDLAHLALTSRVRSHLSERTLIDWYIRWLRPPGKEEARTTGAETAIEALIHPWLNKTPEDTLRSYLVETLIELYGDPRIKSGGVWGGIDARHMAIVHRWLTREDMRFFTGVVDATQKDPMWPPRRDFWLKLYDEGKIDAAWAALSSRAFDYAREHLMRQDAKNAYTRVGYQKARQNTSLLIMKIGNKIMVDGCHSYRTHVFDIADPMAPTLFEEGYNCDEIMRASDRRASFASKSHSSIPSWSRWVRDMINSDVPFSGQTRSYTKVSRPRPPKARYTPPTRPETSVYRDRQPAGIVFGGEAAQTDLFRSSGRGPSPAGADRTSPEAHSTRTPISAAAAGRVERASLGASKPDAGEATAIKQTRFPTLTDKMISYGPGAAAAVLAYLEAPGDGRTRPLLSPKSREGLARVRAVKGDLPLSLRNALEYLLINLKTSGVDLDDLFSRAEEPPMPAQSATPPAPQSVVEASPETGGARYPLMPKTAEGRLEHLMKHVDALEEMGMNQAKFERRKDAVVSIKALRERPSDLLPSQIMDLMRLYDQLRQRELDELPASPAAAASASAPPATAPKAAPAFGAQKFPPLPDHPDGRIDLLREYADALEDLGMWKRTFEQRKAFSVAFKKLKERSPDLRPTEIADLQSLYEELRQGGKGKRR
jgi:EH_Signature domain